VPLALELRSGDKRVPNILHQVLGFVFHVIHCTFSPANKTKNTPSQTIKKPRTRAHTHTHTHKISPTNNRPNLASSTTTTTLHAAHCRFLSQPKTDVVKQSTAVTAKNSLSLSLSLSLVVSSNGTKQELFSNSEYLVLIFRKPEKALLQQRTTYL
jgi:hypothetical protein